MTKKELRREELISLLKEPVYLLDYKIVLLMLFHKIISERCERNSQRNCFVDLDNVDWFSLTEKAIKEDNPKLYIEGLKSFVEKNKDVFKFLKELIQILPWEDLERNPTLFKKVVEIFNKVRFSEYPSNLIGDAYETILRINAPMYARKGEIFTPKEVAELMSKLILTNLEKQFNEKTISVFDVACGAGNLLTVFYEKSISRFDKTNTQIELFGQDIKGFLLALAEMNFILHGVEKDNFHLFKGDSLIEPFDRKVNFVMTNPPWNLRLQHIDNEIKKNKKLREEIYKYGIPSKSADWLWLQLINYLIKEKAVVILDNGVLFRGGSEEKVRKAFVEDDSIEAIIQLPEKIFFNTQSGAVLIVLNKKKPIERKGKILFIDASKEFEKHPDIRRLNRLKNEGISKILKVYRDYLEIEDFSVIVDREQIAKNFFNLNPSIYFVDQRKENPPTPMEINELLDELERLNKEYNEKFEEIKQYLKEAKKVL